MFGEGQRWPWYSFFTVRPAKARTPTQTSASRASKKISTGAPRMSVLQGTYNRAGPQLTRPGPGPPCEVRPRGRQLSSWLCRATVCWNGTVSVPPFRVWVTTAKVSPAWIRDHRVCRGPYVAVYAYKEA